MLIEAITHALPEMRAEAEARMTSTCTIREAPSEQTTDDETGEVVDVAGEVVHSGIPCRFRPAGTGAVSELVGGVEIARFDYIVSVPFAATGIRAGQRVICDSSPDPTLVGVEVEVQKPFGGDQITARRLGCTEVA